MDTLYFDFEKITDNAGFYAEMGKQLQLPDYFGNNLDALYDLLTGYMELPLMFYFNNLTTDKMADFADLIATLDDAEENTQGQFSFDYSAGMDDWAD
jgi:ribonuclease inhibitor